MPPCPCNNCMSFKQTSLCTGFVHCYFGDLKVLVEDVYINLTYPSISMKFSLTVASVDTNYMVFHYVMFM